MVTSIRLEPETERRLDDLVAKTGRTKAFYLREMIERCIDDLEDYYLASQALERLRKGEDRVLSSEELHRALDG